MSEEEKKQILIDELLDEIKYEQDFLSYIAGTEYFEVIDIDAKDHTSPSISEEIAFRAMEQQFTNSNCVILYRIYYGTYSVIIAKDNIDKTGIIPNDNPHGWLC